MRRFLVVRCDDHDNPPQAKLVLAKDEAALAFVIDPELSREQADTEPRDKNATVLQAVVDNFEGELRVYELVEETLVEVCA